MGAASDPLAAFLLWSKQLNAFRFGWKQENFLKININIM
jgi:hypothetical protein